ncbi:HIRAN domain-containing protein [Bacteroides congonensis]|uniref:HIRAN domain-containing protein n=1 Tax=Bacteroides congonensis TaxID=1871006 RepID=UPI003A86E0D7
MEESLWLFGIGISLFIIVLFFSSYFDARKHVERKRTKSNEDEILEDLLSFKEKRIKEYVERGDYTFIVKGISYRTEEEINRIRNLNADDELALEYEFNNPFDNDAIKVVAIKENVHVGYVPSISCKEVKRMLELASNYIVKVHVKTDGQKAPFILARIEFNNSVEK